MLSTPSEYTLKSWKLACFITRKTLFQTPLLRYLSLRFKTCCLYKHNWRLTRLDLFSKRILRQRTFCNIWILFLLLFWSSKNKEGSLSIAHLQCFKTSYLFVKMFEQSMFFIFRNVFLVKNKNSKGQAKLCLKYERIFMGYRMNYTYNLLMVKRTFKLYF